MHGKLQSLVGGISSQYIKTSLGLKAAVMIALFKREAGEIQGRTDDARVSKLYSSST